MVDWLNTPLNVHDVCANPNNYPWLFFREGLEIIRLYGGDPGSPAAALLRYAPGARVPRHRHAGYEHILVLRGAQEDERGRYAEGAFVINAPNTYHVVTSESGCIVLAVWEKPVEFQE